MTIEIAANTPLAEAINTSILPKLIEVGWGTGGPDDVALSEYIVLMLVNGKSREDIASELASDLIGLGQDYPNVQAFIEWLFHEVERLAAQQQGLPEPGVDLAQDPNNIDFDTDMSGPSESASSLNAPTGPKSMRSGPAPRGGAREKRMMGHMSKAMDRTANSAALHRVRGQTGNERISRSNPPAGPRFAQGRQSRTINARPAGIQAGLNSFVPPNAPGSPNLMGDWPMATPDLFAILEQQSKMMQQLSQQMMTGTYPQNQHAHNHHPKHHSSINNNNTADRRGRGGKPLFERVQHKPGQPNGEDAASGEDSDMGQSKREPLNLDEAVCKFNQRCTNKDCPYAHASPAAPFGTSIDVHDLCSFGAACKNRKCVARHPSPAARLAHQSEQDCKFFPNCQNPTCPFRHPSMPLCRNGGDCLADGCKFTHLKTRCKYNPCLNATCPFAHEEGQRGVYKDKVWTADGRPQPIDRKFVNENEEETLIPGASGDTHADDGLEPVIV